MRPVFRRGTHMTCQQTAVVRNSKSSWRKNIPRKASKQEEFDRSPEFLISLAIRSKDFHNFVDRIPIARRGRHTEELFDLAEVTDRLHLPSIKAQNKSV